MIAGLGIDMIEVERLEKKISRESGFRELVFTPGEIQYCESMPNRYEHYAARFAAKEAYLKALGTGWAAGTAFNEIGIVNDALGKPGIVLYGNTKEHFSNTGFTQISVALTHLKQVASAVVIIEK